MTNNLVPTIDATGLEAISKLVADALPVSAHTQRAYRSHIRRFVDWHLRNPGELDKAKVRAFLAQMGTSSASRNQALAAIKKLVNEAADNGYLPREAADGISRIKSLPRTGQRTGQWLTLDEAKELVNLPDTETLVGLRDRVLLGLLLECGLRREEAIQVDADQIQYRDRRIVIANLKGKGNKLRTVPVPPRLAGWISRWTVAAGITDGKLLRPVNRGNRVAGRSMSVNALFKRVAHYARQAGFSIAPHDLRRTFGRLTHEAGASIDQIQQTFGHANQRTTELYLGIAQDLENPPCDFLDIEYGSTTKKDKKDKTTK